MANSPEKVWLNRIKRQFNAAVKDMAGQMTYTIESAYQGAIQAFYDDYYPKWYQRTYSTFEASDRANDMFGYNQMGNIFESGIHVDPSFISGNPYRADKGWVFERTFVQGIHGFTLQDLQHWQDRRIQAKWALSKTKLSLNEYRKASMINSWGGKFSLFEKSNKLAEKYSSTMDSGDDITNQKRLQAPRGASLNYNIETKAPHMMRRKTAGYDKERGFYQYNAKHKNVHTNPKRAMDKEFKEITKKKNMKKMFDTILDSHLT